MCAFKAWANVALFGSLGMIAALGYKFPKQPFCEVRCYINTFSHIQDDMGSLTLAAILFFCAFFGFLWFSVRT